MSSNSGYNAWTVKELRDEAKRRGVALTGLTRKQQIIDRILEEAEPRHASGEEDNIDESKAPVIKPRGNSSAEQEDGEGEVPKLDAVTQDVQTTALDHAEDGALQPQESAADEGITEDARNKVPEEETPLQPADAVQELSHNGTLPQDGDDAKEQIDRVEENSSMVSDPNVSAIPPMEVAPSVQEAPPAQQVNPPSGSLSPPEDSRKRKRRSLTPAVNAEDVQKKLRHEAATAEPTTRSIVAEAPASIEGQAAATIDLGAGVSETEAVGRQGEIATATTTESNDVAMEGTAEEEPAQSLVPDLAEQPPVPQAIGAATDTDMVQDAHEVGQQLSAESRPLKDNNNQRYKNLLSPLAAPNGAIAPHIDEAEEQMVTPAIHPATQALYIRNLMRPIHLPDLEAHLNTLATKPGQDDTQNQIVDLHMDHIKTHAFVSFPSLNAAARVRSALHGRVWPQERNRQPLWVDFIPNDKVRDWIEQERSASDARIKRWEVVYDKKDEENVEVTLQEVSAAGASRTQALPFNAPTAPRSMLPPPQVRREGPSILQRKPESAQFLALDTLFKSTATKPKLYSMPVAQHIAERRLDELDARTSRSFVGSSNTSNDNRRYTWENDRLVDDGPEWGLRQDRGGPPRGGFPRRGRGGYAGDGYRSRGDAYRPSDRYDR